VSVRVDLEDAASVGGRVEATGAFRVVGVPEGRWQVRASAHVDGKIYEAKGEVVAGGSVDLVLEPRGR
jgi:hypothetical protein